MNPLAILAIAEQAWPIAKWLYDETMSNDSIAAKVEKEIPVVAKNLPTILQGLGASSAASKAQQIGTAAVVLNTKLVKYIQTALNLTGAGLDVDGYWGHLTDAAFKKEQSALGLNPDGWFGKQSAQAFKIAFPSLAVPV